MHYAILIRQTLRYYYNIDALIIDADVEAI